MSVVVEVCRDNAIGKHVSWRVDIHGVVCVEEIFIFEVVQR